MQEITSGRKVALDSPPQIAFLKGFGEADVHLLLHENSDGLQHPRGTICPGAHWFHSQLLKVGHQIPSVFPKRPTV